MFTIAEFCAGTGAFTQGFQKNKKFKTIYANDINKDCKIIFDANHKDIKMNIEDIHQLDYKNIPNMDIITCGFPCQPYSIAGLRKGFEDERSDVFWKLCEIINYHQPKVFVLENVKNIISHDNKKTFNTIINKLKELNYFITYKIINTCKITNIPHNRERVFIIGFKNENNYLSFKFPENKDSSSESMSIKSILDNNINEKYYYSKRYKVWDIVYKNVTKKYKIYQIRRNIIRENKSDVCPTLTSNMGKGGHNVPIVKDEIGVRKLTPKECFKLQGFNNNYILPIELSDNKLYSLVGNSVTVDVVELIGENIYNSLISNKS